MNQINRYKALNPDKIEIYEVDAYDIEKVIREVFGRYFCIAADMESGGSNEFFPVDGDLDVYDERELLVWQKFEDDTCCMTIILMNELVRLGVIPAGQYLIWG